MFLLFCIWSFVGWCIEIVDMTYETGEYQNRGFLNMPICPIYGFGVLMLAMFFKDIRDNVIALFFCCAILCTSFELLVGLLLEKLFHNVWWDYSHKRLNFKGFICASVSFMWGAGGVLVVRIVEPFTEALVDRLPIKVGLIIICIMSVLIIVDTTLSLMAVFKLNKKIKRIDEISKALLSNSEKIGRPMSDATLKIIEKGEETSTKLQEVSANGKAKIHDASANSKAKLQEVSANGKAKIHDASVNSKAKLQDVSATIKDINASNRAKLKAEYDRLLNEKDIFTDRIIKAFPGIRSSIYPKSLEKLKGRVKFKPYRTKKPLPFCKKKNSNDSEKVSDRD